MSPEQIRGQQPDSRSDLYGLGCVVFEALTGQCPFSGENNLAVQWAHANSPRPVASAIRPALGPSYDAFLARALAVDLDDRFRRVVSSRRPCAPPMSGSSTPRRRCLPTLLDPSEVPAVLPAADGIHPERRLLAHPMGRSRRYGEPCRGQPRHQRAPADSTPGAKAPQRTVEGARAHLRQLSARARTRLAGRLKLIVMVSSVVFIASATLLIRYTNNGTGWKSLLEATHGDPASRLRSMSFNILIGLVALLFLVTIISIGVYRRLLMIVVVVAALVLIGYTSYLPSIGGDGLSDYGSSYWISLAAAVTMAFGGGFATARSDRP